MTEPKNESPTSESPRRRGGRGRPAGPSAEKPPVATVAASRCGRCQSTDRERYFRTVERAIAGVDGDGRPYTHVVWRWTRCAACGQARIDRSHENRRGDPGDRRAA